MLRLRSPRTVAVQQQLAARQQLHIPVPDVCALYRHTVAVEDDIALPHRKPGAVNLDDVVLSWEVTVWTTDYSSGVHRSRVATWATLLGPNFSDGWFSSEIPEDQVAKLELPLTFNDHFHLYHFKNHHLRDEGFYVKGFITFTLGTGEQITIQIYGGGDEERQAMYDTREAPNEGSGGGSCCIAVRTVSFPLTSTPLRHRPKRLRVVRWVFELS